MQVLWSMKRVVVGVAVPRCLLWHFLCSIKQRKKTHFFSSPLSSCCHNSRWSPGCWRHKHQKRWVIFLFCLFSGPACIILFDVTFAFCLQRTASPDGQPVGEHKHQENLPPTLDLLQHFCSSLLADDELNLALAVSRNNASSLTNLGILFPVEQGWVILARAIYRQKMSVFISCTEFKLINTGTLLWKIFHWLWCGQTILP